MDNRIIRRATVVLAASAAVFGIAATPASAESPNYVAPVAQPAAGTGVTNQNPDTQFHQLFASWSAQQSQPRTIANSVAIPSRTPVNNFRVTSPFGEREHPVLGGLRMHKGIDLAAPRGTPVYAPADGVVERAGPFSSYGNYIAIEHGADMETRYGHLSKVAVHAGETVKKGQLIGYVGSTGRSTGPHLHYEVRVDGHAVNPAPYMEAQGDPTAPMLAMMDNSDDDSE